MPEAVASPIVDVVMVAGSIGSLNLAVTVAPTLTPAAPLAGVTLAIVGGWLSRGTGALMSPSISVWVSARL